MPWYRDPWLVGFLLFALVLGVPFVGIVIIMTWQVFLEML